MTFKIKSIWLRCETKQFEQRTPLIPADAGVLVKQGYPIYVESSQGRIFKDEEYKKVGCEIKSASSWTEAPLDAVILGLKELPEDHFPIKHQHKLYRQFFE